MSKNKYVYIFGDFKVNTMSNTIENLNTQEFKNIFFSNDCLPLITKPTRVTQSCASLIDNIYSNVSINTNKCNSAHSKKYHCGNRLHILRLHYYDGSRHRKPS